jgi:hypothetical protein
MPVFLSRSFTSLFLFHVTSITDDTPLATLRDYYKALVRDPLPLSNTTTLSQSDPDYNLAPHHGDENRYSQHGRVRKAPRALVSHERRARAYERECYSDLLL